MSLQTSLLVLDNYDSFTYNIVHLLRFLGVSDVQVLRNDKISLQQVQDYSHIILSPGPGLPMEAGIMPDLVRTYAPTKKILGICLGHQCIGEVFGGRLDNLGHPVHGKATETIVTDSAEALFIGVPERFLTGRYHSWVVSTENFPDAVRITAADSQGYVMALRHKTYDVCGLQFHPESVLTQHGEILIRNWLAP